MSCKSLELGCDHHVVALLMPACNMQHLEVDACIHGSVPADMAFTNTFESQHLQTPHRTHKFKARGTSFLSIKIGMLKQAKAAAAQQQQRDGSGTAAAVKPPPTSPAVPISSQALPTTFKGSLLK